ncbi:MAG: hypothetical protein RL141_873 [Candidatus Parcubacteria bacterium]|jgi:hypothetical protein
MKQKLLSLILFISFVFGVPIGSFACSDETPGVTPLAVVDSEKASTYDADTGKLAIALMAPIGDDFFRVAGGFKIMHGGNPVRTFATTLAENVTIHLETGLMPGSGYTVELDTTVPFTCTHSDSGVNLVDCRFLGTDPPVWDVLFGGDTPVSLRIAGDVNQDGGTSDAEQSYLTGGASFGLSVELIETEEDCNGKICNGETEVCLQLHHSNGVVDPADCFETCGLHPTTMVDRMGCSGAANGSLCTPVGHLNQLNPFELVCIGPPISPT